MHSHRGWARLKKTGLDLAVAGGRGRERTPGLEGHQPGAGRRIAREWLPCHGMASCLAMPEDHTETLAEHVGDLRRSGLAADEKDRLGGELSPLDRDHGHPGTPVG